MQIDQIRYFNHLNNQFYAQVAKSFSQTRQQPWPGWFQLLEVLPSTNFSVLDIGCGNGRFGQFLSSQNVHCSYTGIDNSEELLVEARRKNPGAKILRHDLVELFLSEQELPKADVVVCLAVLHHIPSEELRAKCIEKLTTATKANGLVIFSTWQFSSLPKLLARQKSHPDLEEGDYLLTWEDNQDVMRYCHLTTDEEVGRIVQKYPLKLVKRFSADGHDQNTNHYFIWRKTSAGSL